MNVAEVIFPKIIIQATRKYIKLSRTGKYQKTMIRFISKKGNLRHE